MRVVAGIKTGHVDIYNEFPLCFQLMKCMIWENIPNTVYCSPENRLASISPCFKHSISNMSYLADSPPLPPLSSLFPHLHSDASTLPASTDPFTITTKTGFLPCRSPLLRLPEAFDAMTSIVEDMSIVKLDGSPGLLASFNLGPVIDSGKLPDLTANMGDLRTESGEYDLEAITTIFRDYSFIASAYVLEPCWESWSKDHDAGYGLGRPVLPRCIASPLVKAADM